MAVMALAAVGAAVQAMEAPVHSAAAVEAAAVPVSQAVSMVAVAVAELALWAEAVTGLAVWF